MAVIGFGCSLISIAGIFTSVFFICIANRYNLAINESTNCTIMSPNYNIWKPCPCISSTACSDINQLTNNNGTVCKDATECCSLCSELSVRERLKNQVIGWTVFSFSVLIFVCIIFSAICGIRGCSGSSFKYIIIK